MRNAPLIALTLGTLAGCATPPPAPEVRPVPVATSAPRPISAPAPLASDWNDWPFTPGDWVYRRDEAGSQASFVRAPGGEEVILRCDPTKRVLHLNVRAALGDTTLRTTTMSRSLVMSPTPGWEAPFTTIEIVAVDPLLDAMAFSRGRFVIIRPIAAPFVLRPDPEIGRVIEDCRG